MRLSASTMSRAKKCVASTVLPQINFDGPDSERGRAGHRFLELVPRIGRDVALAQVPEGDVREACDELRVDELPLRPPYRQEVAFAYDALTGKAWEIGESVAAQKIREGLQEWQIPAVADVFARQPDLVEVYDWKFGFNQEVNTEPVDQNEQLRTLALAAARATGASRARVGLYYLPNHKPDVHEYDVFDLAEIAASIRDLYEAAKGAQAAHRAGATLNVRAGLHCRYCPALQHCPATQALASRLVVSADVVERDTKALLTKENAPLAYERWRQMKAVVDGVGDALAMWARENPITTAKGTVYGPVATSKEHVNGAVAFKVVRELHGEAVADAAVEVATSKAAIERAVKPIVAKGECAGAMRRILQAVEAEGGIVTTTSEQIREYRPK
jgi:hypothetical protein